MNAANVSSLGFNTTSQLYNIFLNLTDQRYNDSSTIATEHSRIDSLNTTLSIQNLGFYNSSHSDSIYLQSVQYQSNASGWVNTSTTTNTTLAVSINNNLTVTGRIYGDIWGTPFSMRNGTYADGSIGNTARTTATAFTATTLRCNPFPVGKGFKTDGIGFIVATANQSTFALVAFYESDTNGYPGSLAVSGVVNLSATGALVNSSFGTYSFKDNTLYFACYASSTAGNQRVNVIPLADVAPVLGITSGTAPNVGYTVAYTWGNPVPNPYTAGATYMTALGNMEVLARVRTDI
jgi:hypothetical protein